MFSAIILSAMLCHQQNLKISRETSMLLGAK